MDSFFWFAFMCVKHGNFSMVNRGGVMTCEVYGDFPQGMYSCFLRNL